MTLGTIFLGYDQRLEKQSSTMELAIQSSTFQWDEDYLIAWNEFKKNIEVGSSKNKHGNGNSDHYGQDGVDPQYKIFLENSRADGTSYILEISKNNMPPLFIKYEAKGYLDKENEAQLPEEPKNFLGPQAFLASSASNFDEEKYNSLKTSKAFALAMDEDESGTCKHSQFREKLMVKLREPYDQKEYEQLWKDINEKKQKEGCRDLRGSLILYKKAEYSPSYLEQYNELKEMIDAVMPDKHKVLYLLRGFFYWLQNLVHDDEFLPWMDKACLSIMLGSP
ncbi:uncharacterized protein LOC127787224 [Diospyros lotus]|uniref:uncharacterized protein LOC127787224 n=1 Tax=Diospyros lotus TaxID=55363 RepID=UPI002252DE27|nr:uncharacterized protein LOC127787224 [Diospyros lotus]